MAWNNMNKLSDVSRKCCVVLCLSMFVGEYWVGSEETGGFSPINLRHKIGFIALKTY